MRLGSRPSGSLMMVPTALLATSIPVARWLSLKSASSTKCRLLSMSVRHRKSPNRDFKYVARNFPHAGMLMGGGLRLIKNLLDVTKLDAKTAVFFYANDTFGQAQRGALDALFPRAGLPFQVTDHIAWIRAPRIYRSR